MDPYKGTDEELSRPAVHEAHKRIRSYIHETPVLTSSLIDDLVSEAVENSCGPAQNPHTLRIFFKCENFQKVGAFKARGAFNNVLSLPDAVASQGVCTHSSGNHAQALAYAARVRGIPAHIVMPQISTPSKIVATQSYGAQVHFSGSTSVEREAALRIVQKDTGATFIPPYDSLKTILGQGTTALEMEYQVSYLLKEAARFKDLDAIVAPLGGGGLLGGIATALSGQSWNSHPALVYGAEPSFGGADDACRGLLLDPPARIEQVNSLTIADGLRTPVGELNWTIISDPMKVAAVYSVSEDEIKAAMKVIFERLKIWVEPSAAVPFAVVFSCQKFHAECYRRMHQHNRESWHVGVVLTGGNTTTDLIASIFRD